MKKILRSKAVFPGMFSFQNKTPVLLETKLMYSPDSAVSPMMSVLSVLRGSLDS